MSKLKRVTLSNAEERVRPLLEAAKNKIGKEINLISALANAPTALESYLNFSAALSGGALEPKLKEKIAVATAGYNKCNYCASAHTYIGKHLGIPSNELSVNLAGQSVDSKSAAALNFALQLIIKRGQVNERDFQLIRDADYSMRK